MGVDYGARRIGIAVSNANNGLATPLTALIRRARKRPPVARILELIRQHDVSRLIIGLPLDPRGRENEWTEEVRVFGQRMQERSGVPVEFQDERYSSAEAEAKIRSIGLPRKKRHDKSKIDAGAAAIILQDWLDDRR